MGTTATLKSGIRTVEAAGGKPSTWQLPGLIDGRMKVLEDTYTAVGTGEDAGSVITFATLPTGANILGIYIFANTATSGLTVSVGDADSATRYGSALTSLQTAGIYMLAGLGYIPRVVGTSTNDNKITFTTGGASLTTGIVYGIKVVYSFD